MLVCRFLSLAVLVGLTAGCVTSQPTRAQLEADAFVDAHDRAIDNYFACFENASATFQQTPAGKRLNDIIVSAERSDPKSIDKMSISRHASEQEKMDLLESRASYVACNEQSLEQFSQVHPAFGNLYAEFLVYDDELLVQVLQGEISIGEMNRVYKRRDVEFVQRWDALLEDIQRDFKVSHDAELQRRAEARRELNASLQNWQLQQQIINSQSYSQPTFTNCIVGTYSVNCTSY